MPGQVIAGLVVSELDTVNWQVAVFEEPSVAVSVTVVFVNIPEIAVAGAGLCEIVGVLQLSFPVAPPV